MAACKEWPVLHPWRSRSRKGASLQADMVVINLATMGKAEATGVVTEGHTGAMEDIDEEWIKS
jgi:hypothetical protein